MWVILLRVHKTLDGQAACGSALLLNPDPSRGLDCLDALIENMASRKNMIIELFNGANSAMIESKPKPSQNKPLKGSQVDKHIVPQILKV